MSTQRSMSALTRRDLALMGWVCAVAALVMVIAGILAIGAALASIVSGGPWQVPAPRLWLRIAGTVLVHPGQLAALPVPWGPALSGHPGTYWTVTFVFGAAVLTGLTVLCRMGWQLAGPMPAGHASRFEIRRELSGSAARRTARWTRPSLSPAQGRRENLENLAVPGHLGPHGRLLWTPLENPTGALAPTQSSKSRAELVHKVISAPAGLLASTTKPDLLEYAGLERARRGSPVRVFDATGTTPWPARVRWLLTSGCDDPDEARRRASAMVEAASLDVANVSGNDRVFRSRAKTVVQAYLLAAAHGSQGVDALVEWTLTQDLEPVDLLMPHYPDIARNLRRELGMVRETSDAVWLSVRRAIEPLMDPTLRDLVNPDPDASFNAREFIRDGGSLFFIAGQLQAAQAAPILTALAEHWITTAQQLALEQPHRRLDPPATAVLDEVTHATPVPRLAEFIADSAGRGVLIHWAAQSLAKLEETWDVAGARQLLDNTTLLSVYSGLKDRQTLEWISVLAGHKEQLRYQQFVDAPLSPGRGALGSETVPVYRPGEVRTTGRDRVLVFHRHLRVIEARLVDVTQRRDWPTLQADVDVVRSGQPPIGPDGTWQHTPTQQHAVSRTAVS